MNHTKENPELMSMIAQIKADKERHLATILGQLWEGYVASVLRYLRTEVQMRNATKHQELIGSGRMEKSVDQVIGFRQKKKGMAWSRKGSKALAILKVVELNGQWAALWDAANDSLFKCRA